MTRRPYRVTIPEHRVAWRGVGMGPDHPAPVRRWYTLAAYEGVHYAESSDEAVKIGVGFAWLDAPVHPFRSLTRQTAALAKAERIHDHREDRPPR